VEKLAVDFSFLNVPEKPPKPPDMKKWTRPPDDYVKINFDGAFDQTTKTGGWGYIIRDQAGDFVAAGAGKSVHLRDALHSEAVACIAAIGGAIKTGANRIILESDSSNLVSALKTRSYDKSFIGVLVNEARSLCILNFDSYLFSFNRRACNFAAHELAKMGAKGESQDSVWVDTVPSCVVNIMANDIVVSEV
jgi:ribonuclease HI